MSRFFSVWELWVPWCGEFSLARVWACNLPVQLLLGLARADNLWSKSRRNQDYILLSHLGLSLPKSPGPPPLGLLWQVPEAIVRANYRPILSSERAPHSKKPANVKLKIKILSWAPDGSLTPRQTGLMTISRNLTSTSDQKKLKTPLYATISAWPLFRHVLSILHVLAHLRYSATGCTNQELR
jgi:hypothetical protein